MTKQIRLNAFDMNCVGHIQHGMWTHPRDRYTTYNTLDYWQDLARTAERELFDGIFLADIVAVYDVCKDIRHRAVAHGHAPGDIAVFAGRTAVVGRTRKQAEEKYHEYHRHASIEGAPAHFSGSTGIDLSRYELDEPIRYEKNNANNPAVEAVTTLSREPWTLRRIIGQMGLGSRIAPIVGSADEVADELTGWVEETGIDGFNLSRIVTPEGLEDFLVLVVPILQERGVYKRDYANGMLREKLFGHARLADTHPGALHRRLTPVARRSAAE